ncbi:carboxylate-amine ligase [Sphaerisporangium fuscum]|uniref:carboxylate-amine ligase n=1 Tax=Sphaerisporangium fuscum TaxID=2835868 RepID=UPI001BDCF1FF|nr:glutamate--cysteine ligase [Sphaerisporangium fuscum]
MKSRTGSSVAPRSAPFPGLTVGIEEEFVLVDPATGQPAPVAEEVIRDLGMPMTGQVVPELTRFQVETNTSIHSDLRSLARELVELRAAASAAANRAGAALLACGTCPAGNAGIPPLSSSPRYWQMSHHYRALLLGQGVCGCHVHLGIADREEAIQVSNHTRAWLPLLQALTVNSPIAYGADTGYGSWRAIQWARWPSAGPPPLFASARHYDDLVDHLHSMGAILDRGMVYWMIRPSHHLPTLEFRPADSCATVAEATMLAALLRALSSLALADVRQGVPPPQVDQTSLSAACWRAARDGMEGHTFDILSGRLLPSWQLLDRFLRHLRAHLEISGDLPLVTSALRTLRRHGSGAARQRAAYRRRGRLADVVGLLVAQTTAVPGFLEPHGTAAEPSAV